MGFLLGLSGRPAHPIVFAVVATMRIGFEVGPRVGRQEWPAPSTVIDLYGSWATALADAFSGA